MPLHDSKTCPRCGALFECKVNAPLRCQCADIPLTRAEREVIQARYDDCLCAACLWAIHADVQAADSITTDTSE